jgi:Family of unknown function (DUF6090)
VRIFNSIRRDMLQEDKVLRYVLYAIGEIILVVVGILIALQVNTWNEDRKARAFERVMLQEIRENVHVNLERFRALEKRLQTSDAGIHLFLKESEKTEPDRERLARYFSEMNNGIVFTFNRGAYDSLKAGGLDRLSNRALRSELIDHFDSFLPRHDRFIQLQYDMGWDYRKATLSDVLEPAILRDERGLHRVEMRLPADFDISGRKTLAVLATISEANQAAARRLQRVVAETEKMLKALDAEIDGVDMARSTQQSIQQPEKPIPKRTL